MCIFRIIRICFRQLRLSVLTLTFFIDVSQYYDTKCNFSEDRRRGYVGNDYGEDDDEVDYNKIYEEEDVSLLVSYKSAICVWICNKILAVFLTAKTSRTR